MNPTAGQNPTVLLYNERIHTSGYRDKYLAVEHSSGSVYVIPKGYNSLLINKSDRARDSLIDKIALNSQEEQDNKILRTLGILNFEYNPGTNVRSASMRSGTWSSSGSFRGTKMRKLGN